ncbi:MAG: fimbrial major subunit CsuA/B family protein [Acidobacteria bacterium]|nr:fimbrial major subunit CsuA/B family protein [Acidobacteriota bacterium]
MNRRPLIAVAALLVWPLGKAPQPANPGTLSVGLTVPSVCTIAGATLDFGASTEGPIASQASATVSCNQGQPWRISANSGLHSTTGTRQLRAGSGSSVPYLLFIDEAMSVEMGDGELAGTYPSGSPIHGIGTGQQQSVPIFGLVPIFDSGLPAGEYTDEILLTVHF